MATSYLATVIGWYLIIFSVYLFVNRDNAVSIMREAMSNRPLFFVIAVMTVILGLLMVASHNIWVKDWTVVVTIFSWLVLVGGLLRLFIPETVLRMGSKVTSDPSRLFLLAAILMLVGLYLLLHVYGFL